MTLAKLVKNRRMNRSHIIATLGPASHSTPVLTRMVAAGMDVVRLNFSHGTHYAHRRKINTIRKINQNYNCDIKILQDLEGYRIRLGDLDHFPDNLVPLTQGQRVVLSNHPHAAPDTIPFDYQGSLNDIPVGSDIFIDDGNIALKVKTHTRTTLKAQVITPGILKPHKGLNIPDIKLPFIGLKEKDRLDLLFGIKHNVDYIAQSFVRTADDILIIREILDQHDCSAKLIAKIENRQGVENLNDILRVADGIMIARGDMGVSLPIYEVPLIQKQIIRTCNKKKKFVITATQMLETMTQNLRPTRAEVSDVANAILDGSDFVMLSGETAVGKHPVAAVQMMDDIITHIEEFQKNSYPSKHTKSAAKPSPRSK